MLSFLHPNIAQTPQIKNYPWANFRCEPASKGNILEIRGSGVEISLDLPPKCYLSGLDPTMAGEDVELPITSGPLSKTYSFRDSTLQWQERMLNCPSSLAHCWKPTLFGTRPYNGRRGCWIAPHLWPIVDNQLKTECWCYAGCGNSPIVGAAPGLQYWLCFGLKMTCLGYYHVLHLLPALPFCRLCANIFMFTTIIRSRCTDADFIKYTHSFWISDFGKIVFSVLHVAYIFKSF